MLCAGGGARTGGVQWSGRGDVCWWQRLLLIRRPLCRFLTCYHFLKHSLLGIDQLPENVDPGKREDFLTDAEFLEVTFKLTLLCFPNISFKQLECELRECCYIVKDKRKEILHCKCAFGDSDVYKSLSYIALSFVYNWR